MNVLIMVVDDEPDMEGLFRQQFRRDLRAGRFDMVFALSAQTALDVMAAVRDKDLILLMSDINMPGMSGLELLERAKALRPELPVLMITAYGDPETRRRALDSGAAGLLTKPLDFGVLRAEVDARLPPRESAA